MKLHPQNVKRLGIFVVAALLLSYPIVKTVQSVQKSLPLFALLIPKESENLISTQVWLQAAQEEGVTLQALPYDALLNSFRKSTISSKVIIVPDEVARYAPAVVLSTLQIFVQNGGKLVLVADALSQEFNQRMVESFPLETYFGFPKVRGRVGDTIQYKQDPVRLTPEWAAQLQIPPGATLKVENELLQICNYQSLQPPYPHWETVPLAEFKGKVLLQGADGSVVAGISKLGKGEVLWINLPLSYLKKRTDGLFLHAFIRWIAEDWIGFPKLLSVPNGVGGIVLNVHVDSNASLPGLEIMKNVGMFKQGPFSMHVTAGPDAHVPGDHLGFNLPENSTSQKWVKFWVANGHEVGAHGGWVHDYFGKNLPLEHSTQEFENFLKMNQDWVAKISGKPVVEYSAPIGNHPIWVNDWIQAHGFNTYYFTGNTGLGPTKAFRDETFTDRTVWSFPVASYQQAASFEEANMQQIPQQEFQGWLIALSNYVVQSQSARLFYFHPPGVRFYENSLKEWMKLNLLLSRANRFRWYTMNQLATFLNERQKINWSIVPTDTDGLLKVIIPGGEGLQHMVWRFPKKSTRNLNILKGDGSIRESQSYYEFQAANNNEVEIQYEDKNP